MKNFVKRWEVLNSSKVTSIKYLESILLDNRGIISKKEKEEFLNPTSPIDTNINKIGIKNKDVEKIIARLKKAKDKNEFVIIYGDYDADGVTATAILWETLHEFGLDILPYIPDRFEDGYGIKQESVEKIKNKFPKLSLIITVDNGVVAYDGLKKAQELGIDVIVVDHHQKGTINLPTNYLLHSTNVCGSALAWFLSKEVSKKHISERLSLAAIGTIADQMLLVGINRSIVKYGLKELENTKRPGLLELFLESGLKQGLEPCKIGTYEVNYVIAPRINAMGRLKNGIESLRLICTTNKQKALLIAEELGKTNKDRQKIVDDVLLMAKKNVTNENVIVVAGENYHEGVIGLAAGKLVEEFYRPAIVFSIKGDVAKASARSISGFNIIEAIRSVNLHIEGGGHPMAAGFSIKTSNIDKFTKEINKLAKKLLTDDILNRKLKIDCELNFGFINLDLLNVLKKLDPIGVGNPSAVFVSKKVELIDIKTVGKDRKHIKIKLKQGEQIFDSIYFGGGEMYSKLSSGTKVDIAYNVEENVWNGYKNIQLKIKDIIL